jgi:hypothetical protein
MPCRKEFRFEEQRKMVSPPFVIYADSEAILVPSTEPGVLQRHKVIACAFLIVPTYTRLRNPFADRPYRSFQGEDCMCRMLEEIERVAMEVREWVDAEADKVMTPLTVEEVNHHESKQVCYICGDSFTGGRLKVHDHCHYTGKYLNAACQRCNLARRLPKIPKIPIAFHNLRGYDMHFIVKNALSNFDDWGVDVIAQSSEKFLSLYARIPGPKVMIHFIDSLQFLLGSLDRLSSSLNEFPFTDSLLGHLPEFVRRRKGVFCYGYLNDAARLDEVELPVKEDFHDALKDCVAITDEDYEHAQRVWRETGCTTLRDYMMLYLNLDVCLLADVFERFRRETREDDDGLDPVNFVSIPGLSWASAFKRTKAEIHLLTCPEQHSMFERGIRGGMTFVNKHYVKGSEETDLLYLDVNNLYGWALSQPLPQSDFKWVPSGELNALLERLPGMDPVNESTGYVFEVDLHTPEALHNSLDELPPAPVSMRVPGQERTPPKLLLTHLDKKNYVIHYRLLKYYIELGVVVTGIHRAVSFKQSAFFKSYIDHNTGKRAQTQDEIAKTLYKLKNNSLFGKTMENLRKRCNIRVVNSEERFVTYASRPTFTHFSEIDADLFLIFLLKEGTVLDRPIYIGQAVLDLSKLLMYQMYYEKLRPLAQAKGGRIGLLGGDTDSFFLELDGIRREDYLADMLRDGLFDSSNYPPGHPLYRVDRKAHVGIFKDEVAGERILEWVLLRPKCYAYKLENGEESKKAKGVQRYVAENKLTFNHYLDCYQNSETLRMQQRGFRSFNHNICTVQNNKIALTPFDDKRAWNGNLSRAYGHTDNPD